MEQNIHIQTQDNHTIYGLLNSSKKDKLIIFVHGLTGHKNEHIFYNAAKFFSKNKFDTFRFDLYSGEKGARSLTECTIETHSQDITQVIDHFKKNYKKIHLVGHSLGGPSIILANIESAYSIALWDPSFNTFEGLRDDMTFNTKINKYILHWGTEYLLSKEMVESWKRFDERMLAKFSKPTKIICAGKGMLHERWRNKLHLISVNHEFVLIPEAGHCFDEENTEQELFNETLKWFEK